MVGAFVLVIVGCLFSVGSLNSPAGVVEVAAFVLTGMASACAGCHEIGRCTIRHSADPSLVRELEIRVQGNSGSS